MAKGGGGAAMLRSLLLIAILGHGSGFLGPSTTGETWVAAGTRHPGRPVADDEFKVGFADPNAEARKQNEIAAFAAMLSRQQTIKPPDILQIANDPMWQKIIAGSSSIPLFLLALVYFFQNNFYGLQVIDGNPINIRFPESSLDGTSLPNGIEIPGVTKTVMTGLEKIPDIGSVRAALSVANPLLSLDGSSLGGFQSLIPTASSMPVSSS